MYIDITTNLINTIVLIFTYKFLVKGTMRDIGFTSLIQGKSWYHVIIGTATGLISILSVYGVLYLMGFIKTASAPSYSAIPLYFIMFITVSIL